MRDQRWFHDNPNNILFSSLPHFIRLLLSLSDSTNSGKDMNPPKILSIKFLIIVFFFFLSIFIPFFYLISFPSFLQCGTVTLSSYFPSIALVISPFYHVFFIPSFSRLFHLLSFPVISSFSSPFPFTLSILSPCRILASPPHLCISPFVSPPPYLSSSYSPSSCPFCLLPLSLSFPFHAYTKLHSATQLNNNPIHESQWSSIRECEEETRGMAERSRLIKRGTGVKKKRRQNIRSQ